MIKVKGEDQENLDQEIDKRNGDTDQKKLPNYAFEKMEPEPNELQTAFEEGVKSLNLTYMEAPWVKQTKYFSQAQLQSLSTVDLVTIVARTHARIGHNLESRIKKFGL